MLLSRVPPNVKFEIDDVESPWLHNTPFDFIFCRYMAGCIQDWPKLVGNVYEWVATNPARSSSCDAGNTNTAWCAASHVAPGGWAEFQDFDVRYYSEDGSLKPEHHASQFVDLLVVACDKIGRDPVPGLSLEKWVKDAGFVDVVHKKFRFPIGTWPKDPKLKEVGMYNLAQSLQGLEAFSLRLLCDVLKWRQEEVLVLTSKVRKELKDMKIHPQYDL